LFQKAIRPDTGDLDALLFAVQIEKESLVLCRELAQASFPMANVEDVEKGNYNFQPSKRIYLNTWLMSNGVT
jgi:hypothetical protein